MNKEVESKSKIVNANFFKKNGSKIITFMFVLLILVYAMNMAFKRAAFVDFYAVDGDFQNYDAWRRILHGFVPFRDFSVYLGLGHLYIGALFTLIFGGTFASSLFVGVFLTITLTASIIFVIVKLITKNTNVSLLASTLFVVGYEVYPGVIDYLTKKIFSVSTNYITPGPSARILRGSCVILYFLIVFLIIKKLYFKSFLKFSICTSLFNGFLILFSNDTGISSFVASSLCFLILLIKKYKYDWKKNLKYIIIWILGTLSIWLLIIIITTHVNIGSYFESILGTSGAQSWYYQLFPKTYVFSFFDIFTHFKLFDYLLLFYIVLEFILTIKTQNTNEYLFHVGLLFIYLSYFFDRWLYAIFSSTTKTDFIALVLFSSTFGYLFNLLVHKGKETESSTKNSFSIFLVSIICISCFAISQINLSKEVINTYATRAENGVYYKNLGGYLSNDGVSLYAGVPGVSDEGFDTLIDKTKGKNFFSTYSSALEVINNKFSKSHEDYIIHALGPKAQKNYLKNFQKNNYNVFLTPSIKSSLGYYEWIINSNWYFFKYIFEHYHYVDTHSYADIWRKDNKNRIISSKYSILTQKIKVTVMEGVSDITGIEIKTSKKINGIASLKIKYKVVDQTFGTIHSNIGIISALPDEFAGKAGSSYFNLPIKGEYEIPVYLNNGKGVALLFPFPQNKSNLIIESTKISEIIKYDYKNISNQ